MLLSLSQDSSIIGVCTKTLRRWHEKKLLIPDCRTIGGHRRYSIENLTNFTRQSLGNQRRRKKTSLPLTLNRFQSAAIYARVSVIKQKGDLTRQIAFLIKRAKAVGYTEVIVYKDIASGLNDKRPGLKRLIKDAFARKFTSVFITHTDRLARFGTTLLYQVLLLLDIDIVEKGTSSQAPQKDDSPANALVQDVLAILTSYSGRLYRLRRGTFA
jgi:predicted site-specific integrase-resolvase